MADDAVVEMYEETDQAVPGKERAFQGAPMPNQALPPQGDPGQDDEKTPKSGRKRKAETSQGCASLDDKDAAFSASIHLANLEGARGSFTGAAIDYRIACTAAEDNTCQIVRHLPVWNEFLCKGHVELQETTGEHGQLSLSACRGVCAYHASSDEFQQAAALAYWLLKTHRCVAVVDIHGSIWDAHPALAASALRDSPSVKSVTVSTYSLDVHKGLSVVIPTLTHLREFECSRHVRFHLAAAIPLLLQKAKSLTSLRIPALRWEDRQAARNFFEALVTTTTLKELSFHDSALAELQSPKLAKQVMSTIAPAMLTLQLSHRPSQDSLYMGLLGLSLNRSISKVCLVSLPLDEERVSSAVGLVWRENSVIRSFHMLSTQWHFNEGRRRARCPSAFLLNETLEETTLPLHIWDEEKWRLFFAALAKKSALRKVTIEIFFIDSPGMREVCDAIKESQVEDKVFFRDMRTRCTRMGSAFRPVRLEGSRLSELYVDQPWERGGARLSRLMRQLPLCGPVTSLDLPAEVLNWNNDTLLSALGDYICSTTMLRTFRLSAQYFLLQGYVVGPDRFWTVIAHALRENGSIRDLGLELEHISEEEAEDLVDAVRASPNICKVHFGAHQPLVTQAVVRRLSLGIAEDCRLVEVTLKDMICKDLDRDWFAIQDAVGRNCRMVARAAQYVSGAVCDRYRALALEKISGYPVLVEEVAELVSVSVEEAAAKVKEGLRSFKSMDDFMRLAGVVNERVACHSREDGRTQIDELNADCWAMVRQYLKLGDIQE